MERDTVGSQTGSQEGGDDASPEGGGERRFGKRQEQILRAALHVFGRRGFHRAQMDEVAQAAGVGKGTLYHHFESKEALLRDAILYLMDLHQRQLDARMAKVEDSVDKLYQQVLGDYTFTWKHRRLAKIAFTEATGLGHSAAFRASIMEVFMKRHQQLVRLMEEGQRAGQLRADMPSDLLATVFRGMVREITSEILFIEGPRRDADELARNVMNIFLKGAQAERSAAAPGRSLQEE